MSDAPAAVRRNPVLPWVRRIVDSALAYLPMLVMAALALGSWWLVKQTPVAEGAAAPSAPRSDPDYTMRTFVVQRFAKDGTLRTTPTPTSSRSRSRASARSRPTAA